MPSASTPPKVSASEGFIAVAAPVAVDEAAPDVELAVLVVESVPVADAAISPLVPLETALPARLTVASAARAWKFSSERVAFLAVLEHY